MDSLSKRYFQAWCTPSRAAALTGVYPYHSGRQVFDDFVKNGLSNYVQLQHSISKFWVLGQSSLGGLSLEYKLLPQYLKEVGYGTHLVGKYARVN